MKINSQIKGLCTMLSVLSLTVSAYAQSLNGDWSGKLSIGGGRELRLVLHINEATSKVTMDSPDQMAYGLECQTIFFDGDSINFQIPSLMMSYEGKAQNDKIDGTFQQHGIKLPLTFLPGIIKANRPQTPQPPFPYTQEDVKISTPDSTVTLAGTLTLPQNSTPATPVVVLVSGSGAQNRDEEIFEHKPFAVIADFLARNGVASLRYDDRGFGESSGDRTNATTEDYASDAKAAIDWIRNNRNFGKTGIIGHSEGGIIAYMLGAAPDGTDFIISIAGPSVIGSEILDYQNKVALMRNGLTEKQAEEYAINARHKLEADPAMKWMHYFLSHDPATDISNLKIPTFIIYGEKDQQVPPSLNLERARSLAPNATIKCYPELNHLMQHANTGNVDEYPLIEETISPQILSDILSFIKTIR